MDTSNPSKSNWLIILWVVFSSSTQAKLPDHSVWLAPVIEQTCEQTIVVLGELPSHGEALTFQAKAQIVQALVGHCGFNGLFFEAPIYDFYGFRQATSAGTATAQQLDNAIGGFWLTEELKAWRNWLFTQAQSGQMKLAGLDDQISITSEYAKATLPAWVAEALDPQQAKGCKMALERHFYWRYDAQQPFDQAERQRLLHCAQSAAEAMANSQTIDADQQQLLHNLTNLFARQSQSAGAMDRDEALFRNFQWQYKTLPANSKVIIWTATVHAARKQGPLKVKPMGAWLTGEWGDQMSAIGFTAFGGQSSMAGMPVQTLPDAAPGSLEARAVDECLKPDQQGCFYSQQQLTDIGPTAARLLGKFMTEDWAQMFDGVVVFEQEQAPTFPPK